MLTAQLKVLSFFGGTGAWPTNFCECVGAPWGSRSDFMIFNCILHEQNIFKIHFQTEEEDESGVQFQ